MYFWDSGLPRQVHPSVLPNSLFPQNEEKIYTENTELETNLSSDSVSAPRAPRRKKEKRTVFSSFPLLGALGADTESEERFVSNSVFSVINLKWESSRG